MAPCASCLICLSSRTGALEAWFLVAGIASPTTRAPIAALQTDSTHRHKILSEVRIGGTGQLSKPAPISTWSPAASPSVYSTCPSTCPRQEYPSVYSTCPSTCPRQEYHVPGGSTTRRDRSIVEASVYSTCPRHWTFFSTCPRHWTFLWSARPLIRFTRTFCVKGFNGQITLSRCFDCFRLERKFPGGISSSHWI